MAIEKINGIDGVIPPEIESSLIELAQQPMLEGVNELEDGSAIIGEMEMEAEAPIAIPFDANLAEHIDEDVLSEISNEITGNI